MYCSTKHTNKPASRPLRYKQALQDNSGLGDQLPHRVRDGRVSAGTSSRCVSMKRATLSPPRLLGVRYSAVCTISAIAHLLYELLRRGLRSALTNDGGAYPTLAVASTSEREPLGNPLSPSRLPFSLSLALSPACIICSL